MIVIYIFYKVAFNINIVSTMNIEFNLRRLSIQYRFQQNGDEPISKKDDKIKEISYRTLVKKMGKLKKRIIHWYESKKDSKKWINDLFNERRQSFVYVYSQKYPFLVQSNYEDMIRSLQTEIQEYKEVMKIYDTLPKTESIQIDYQIHMIELMVMTQHLHCIHKHMIERKVITPEIERLFKISAVPLRDTIPVTRNSAGVSTNSSSSVSRPVEVDEITNDYAEVTQYENIELEDSELAEMED